MASNHRHDTDRTETILVGSCPHGCQSLELVIAGPDETADDAVEQAKTAFGECSTCGAEMGFVRRDKPSEVLE